MSRTSVGAVLMITTFGLGPAGADAQDAADRFVGSWLGQLTPQIRIVFHVERGADGAYIGTIDSPDQGVSGAPVSAIEVDGDAIAITVAAFGASFSGDLRDDGSIPGTFSQAGANIPVTLMRQEVAVEAPNRPQEPHAPFPYDVEDVRFANAEAGIELAGTITTPAGTGPFPGVVLISGSGAQDRDESLAGHRPFLVLADHLTRSGIAVLRFDDRGTAESGGDFTTATSSDFASDALAALAFLGDRDRVDAERVGLVGHSEGGLIAPMAANRSDDVAFVVMLAGPALPGLEILVAQGRLINDAAGVPAAVSDLNERIQRGLADIAAQEPDIEVAAQRMEAHVRAEIAVLPEALRGPISRQMTDEAITATVARMNSAWFRFFLHHDPRPDLERMSVPVLAVTGQRDLQVPPSLNDPELEAAFERGGNADATVRVLPGLNHLFQEAETGLPGEYGRIEETMSPGLLEVVSSWVLERFAEGR